MTGQAIRPSQFVFTFGVGSIIEASNGPRIIKDFSEWGRVFDSRSNESVSDFAIYDSIASAVIDGQIFSIPTNAQLNEPENRDVFKTGHFPNWALCVRHGFLYKLESGDDTQCPECGVRARGQGRKEAIRFVRACKDGHMDDIDWHRIIHRQPRNECSVRAYRWHAEGGSLRNVMIVCECGAQASLSDVYNMTKHCTGKYPEKGGQFTSCGREASVTLRGSSSLRIPEIVTTITLPRFASKLHRIMDDMQIRTIIAMKETWTKKEFLASLDEMMHRDPTLLDMRVRDAISSTDDARFVEVVKDVKKFRTQRPTQIDDVRREEFRSLQEAAQFGFPPNPDSENPEFQVNCRHVRNDMKLGRYNLRVTPVDRLRVVNVQTGYRRLGTDTDNKIVPTFYFDGKRKWFPGMEQIGEGIFIDMADVQLELKSHEWDEQFLSHDKNMHYSATFVWWHTLSHRIINALSIDSGYSSAAIRESVYAVHDQKTDQSHGGVLLYTVQSGGDGTLGGLLSLVPQFESVLDAAIKNLHFCSNDPLCQEDEIKSGKHSGASCYACTLLSETSCAHRNMYLDRNLLRCNV